MAIIEVKNVSKKYQIGERTHYLTLRDSLAGLAKAPWRALKGEHSLRDCERDFWALRDVSFDVEQGEVMGIIGSNGSGKSTMLKILSRITPPTTGEVRLRGRVASLLEVGTGFHPELTGRENILLNGTILGMRRAEVMRKMGDIIEFSGVSQFIDTPVKRYSSGMYVRLAFSVAAHLESDVLIVDEVLAVGDAEFQKKCLGKMESIATREGRTVLFVSHNMDAVSKLCSKCALLKEGRLVEYGAAMEVISKYLGPTADVSVLPHHANMGASLKDVTLEAIEPSTGVYRIRLAIDTEAGLSDAQVAIGIDDSLGNRVATMYSKWTKEPLTLRAGLNHVCCEVRNFALKPGRYQTTVFIGREGHEVYYQEHAASLIVPNFNFFADGTVPDESQGNLMIYQKWTNA